MKLLTAIFTLFVVSVSYTNAEPVPDDQRIPVDFRRSTLLVNNMQSSLALYHEALGMTVVYDQMLETPMDNGEMRKRRLVLLRANDNFIGVLGLLQYIYPAKPQRVERFDTPVPGDPIFVINAKNLDEVWPKVAASPGVEVKSIPEMVIYPRKGGGNIKVMQSMVRDPDGYWLEINKILDAPASSRD